jgi:hypothetical protein
MSDLNRSIMKFEVDDKPTIVALYAILVLVGVDGLLVCALNSAYAIQ